MAWSESISRAIAYIEAHLQEPLSVEDIARAAALSPFYFQRGFSMLCDMSVGEYIRKRRLSQAGVDVLMSERSIIDIALDYGYDSADGFTKAFTRFHGLTPTTLRKNGGSVVSFAPLSLKISLEGGKNMTYRIEKKDAFVVLCRAATFTYEEGPEKVPAFWQEHFAAGGAQIVRGLYGINLDERMSGDTFEYLIADPYDPAVNIPEGFVTRSIPAYIWAVFPCKGKMAESLRTVNKQIFSEWLPANSAYEIAAGINIERYDDASKYPKGIEDDDYYSEVWIPIKKRA
ncbi:MAG: AraC family transcriptional regulator [Peptococcaceae bacterium]|nr:AraC family transcriptional regulator [Peptococcaceae bacterium]